MAQVIFPPVNWTQVVNVNDTIVLDYKTPYAGVNLTLFCETAKGTDDWINWNLPGPLAANGSYNLHLANFDFIDWVNVWPTDCLFEIANWKNSKQLIDGGTMTLSTKSNVADKTYALSSGTARATSASDLPSPTATHSGSANTSTVSGPAATNQSSMSAPDTEATGLSSGARIGIGVGAGVGGLLLLVLSFLLLLSYRKRRRQERNLLQMVDEKGSHLQETDHKWGPHQGQYLDQSGTSYNKPPPSANGYIDQTGVGGQKHWTLGQQSQWGPPQELGVSENYNQAQSHELDASQRHELS